MKVFIICFLFLFIGGCSNYALHTVFPDYIPLKYVITEEDRKCMLEAQNTATSFIVDESEVEEVWDRALFFVKKFSKNKCVHFTNHHIRSDNPMGFYDTLDYIITKYEVSEGKYLVEVRCNQGEFWAGKKALRNTQLATYYIKTGIMCSEELIYE